MNYYCLMFEYYNHGIMQCFTQVFLDVILPGHSALLQLFCFVDFPEQLLPPFFAGCTTLLVAVIVPSPHVTVQVDQVPQLPHLQLTEKDGPISASI